MSSAVPLHIVQRLAAHTTWAGYEIAGAALALLGFGPGAFGLTWAIISLAMSKLRHVRRIPR